jgi:hypothetical protein
MGGTALLMSALVACQGGAEGEGSREGAITAPRTSSAAVDPAVASAAPELSLWTPSPAPPLSARRAKDLADDVAKRLEAVRAAEEAPKHVETVDGLFVVAGGDPRAPFDDAVDLTRRLVAALYAGPLTHRPDEGVILWVYSSPETFVHGMMLHAPDVAVSAGQPEVRGPRPLPIGAYDDLRRTIVVRTDAGGRFSVAHEVAHPLVFADFPHAPPWIAEGVPALFEVPDFSKPGEVHGKAHFRLQTLRDALASKDPAVAANVRLDALFTMALEFYGPQEYLRYAMAREALRWMDSLGKLWEFYGTFRENILDDADGTKAFARVFGKSPVEANEQWLTWIRSKDAEGTP